MGIVAILKTPLPLMTSPLVADWVGLNCPWPFPENLSPFDWLMPTPSVFRFELGEMNRVAVAASGTPIESESAAFTEIVSAFPRAPKWESSY